MAKKGQSAGPASKINLLIADDHSMILDGLRIFFEDTDVKVVAEAADGRQALAKILSFQPDVALLDLLMPNMTGIEILKELREKKCPTKVILLTGSVEEKNLVEAISLGAKGFISKNGDVDEINKAIHRVMDGDSYICPILGGALLSKKLFLESSTTPPGLSLLTNSEKEVLKSMVTNRTNNEIANELKKSVKTVKNHRAHICLKLGLKGQNALLHFVAQNEALLKKPA